MFKLDPAGNETVLYTFSGGADGGTPLAGLLRDEEGNLYGTTSGGGDLSGCSGQGCGVVFKLDRAGKETVLYTFTGGADGATPQGDLLLRGGNLYGTTLFGGDLSGCSGQGCGVVFKLDRAGKESVLYAFSGGTDGANPFVGLVRDKKGNLFGTTGSGGDLASSYCGGQGCGVVFKLTAAAGGDEDSPGQSSTVATQDDSAPATSSPTTANSLLVDNWRRYQLGPFYRMPGSETKPKN